MDVRVAEWLRGEGHDAMHLRDEGLQRLPNGGIFAKALAEERVIVTFDLDFSEIAALAAGPSVSVIVFRLRDMRVPHVIDRLSVVLPDLIPRLDKGAIVSVEESRVRIRYLPLGGHS